VRTIKAWPGSEGILKKVKRCTGVKSSVKESPSAHTWVQSRGQRKKSNIKQQSPVGKMGEGSLLQGEETESRRFSSGSNRQMSLETTG